MPARKRITRAQRVSPTAPATSPRPARKPTGTRKPAETRGLAAKPPSSARTRGIPVIEFGPLHSGRAQEALRASEGRLRAILNTVADAIVTFDCRGTITGVNPATERMFGHPEAELLGQNIRMLMPSPCHEEHGGPVADEERLGWARVIDTRHEVRGRRKDGSVFPIELAVGEVDRLRIYTGVIHDISERKRLQAEVLRIADDEQLRFAADLHDGICQELVGIQYLQILLSRDLQKAHHPLASRARRIEKAIIAATERTRQVARGLNPVVADGSGLMHALRRLAETMSRPERARCLFQCRAPVSIENPTVANQLFRIAQEAIHNAIHHGGAKRVTVRLTGDGGEIRLAVMDNGRGLPAGPVNGPGMGVRVMRYRAGSIGGHFILQPRPRGGAEVLCRIPRSSPEP